MAVEPRKIELLAPAKDADTALEALKCGADAVYMGPSRFGARSAAGNSIDDIKRVTDFAHLFNARVYVTVNTIIKEDELDDVRDMICELYDANVDALIVQDMGILRLDIPPIALHASTQCDIRTVEKARFLASAGFSQIVLARELTFKEIEDIHNAVDVPIESFVHGALCVSYSGRCHVSEVLKGRSANRGECAQLCRLPYDLIDGGGIKLKSRKHLLSLRDLNQSSNIQQMLEAGVSSFKIEGRLKDQIYVRNVVSYYRKRIDEILAANADKYVRASFGISKIPFVPQLDKSFNRGFTHYFLEERNPANTKIASIDTPKSLGEPLGTVISCKGKDILVKTEKNINNGDGISYFNSDGEYDGFRVNIVFGNKIQTLQNVSVAPGTRLFRTYSKQFEDEMEASNIQRLLNVDFSLSIDSDSIVLKAEDELGNKSEVKVECDLAKANKPQKESQIRVLSKLGNTYYVLNNALTLDGYFIPASILTEARRKSLESLEKSQIEHYKRDTRVSEDENIKYFKTELTYFDNVSNSKSASFYKEHGVLKIAPALEIVDKNTLTGDEVLMTTRYCLRRELGYCKKTKNGVKLKEPLRLVSDGNVKLQLEFDCSRCEMKIRKAKGI